MLLTSLLVLAARTAVLREAPALRLEADALAAAKAGEVACLQERRRAAAAPEARGAGEVAAPAL